MKPFSWDDPPAPLKKVGFWRSDHEPELPDVTAMVDESWRGAERRLVLEYVCLEHKTHASYHGRSNCRLCGKQNGSTDITDGTYVWPSGFRHYLQAHHIRPPQDFIDHAIAQQKAITQRAVCVEQAREKLTPEEWDALRAYFRNPPLEEIVRSWR